LTEIVAFMNDG